MDAAAAEEPVGDETDASDGDTASPRSGASPTLLPVVLSTPRSKKALESALRSFVKPAPDGHARVGTNTFRTTNSVDSPITGNIVKLVHNLIGRHAKQVPARTITTVLHAIFPVADDDDEEGHWKRGAYTFLRGVIIELRQDCLLAEFGRAVDANADVAVVSGTAPDSRAALDDAPPAAPTPSTRFPLPSAGSHQPLLAWLQLLNYPSGENERVAFVRTLTSEGGLLSLFASETKVAPEKKRPAKVNAPTTPRGGTNGRAAGPSDEPPPAAAAGGGGAGARAPRQPASPRSPGTARPELSSSAAELSTVTRPELLAVTTLLHKNAEHITSPTSMAGFKRALDRVPHVIGDAIPAPKRGALGAGGHAAPRRSGHAHSRTAEAQPCACDTAPESGPRGCARCCGRCELNAAVRVVHVLPARIVYCSSFVYPSPARAGMRCVHE
jgi:hypothetical protein